MAFDVVDEMVRRQLPAEELGVDELDVDPSGSEAELAPGHRAHIVEFTDSRMGGHLLEDAWVISEGNGEVEVHRADLMVALTRRPADHHVIDAGFPELEADLPEVVQD